MKIDLIQIINTHNTWEIRPTLTVMPPPAIAWELGPHNTWEIRPSLTAVARLISAGFWSNPQYLRNPSFVDGAYRGGTEDHPWSHNTWEIRPSLTVCRIDMNLQSHNTWEIRPSLTVISCYRWGTLPVTHNTWEIRPTLTELRPRLLWNHNT